MLPEKILIWKNIKTCFEVYLQEKNNETVGLCPTILAREILLEK